MGRLPSLTIVQSKRCAPQRANATSALTSALSRGNRQTQVLIVIPRPGMPAKKLFRIGRSRTGLGLFAVEPIKSRQFIVRYSGRLVAAEVADRLERYRRNKFLFEVN